MRGLSAKHAETPFTRDDWRFTANPAGDTVYAFCMAPGDARNLRVRALGTGTGLSRLPLPGPGDPKKAEGRPLPPDAPGLDRPVRNVSVVGTDRRIVWKQETGHLSVELPDGVPMQAGRLPIALKIEV